MNSGEFNKHDHIDRDVFEISKDSLRLLLETCAQHASLPTEIRAYGGLTLTLFSAALLTDNFHNLWSISGETIQAAFLIGGIVSLIVTCHKLIKWYPTKNNYSPESIINSLASKKTEPIALIEAPRIQKNRVTAVRATRSQKSN